MIDSYNFTIILIIQYFVVFIYGILLFFRKNEIFKEEKIIENILIFFLIGCGFKIIGLSIFDEIFNIIACSLVILAIFRLKKYNLKKYFKYNIITVIILTYLILKTVENINLDNFIKYFRFIIIFISILFYSLYFYSSKKIQKINYNLILNIGKKEINEFEREGKFPNI